MIVDSAWIARNIGVDPTTVSIPKSAFATRAALLRLHIHGDIYFRLPPSRAIQ